MEGVRVKLDMLLTERWAKSPTRAATERETRILMENRDVGERKKVGNRNTLMYALKVVVR